MRDPVSIQNETGARRRLRKLLQALCLLLGLEIVVAALAGFAEFAELRLDRSDIAGRGDLGHFVGFLVEGQCATLDQVPGEFANMHRLFVAMVELLLQHLRETVGLIRTTTDAGEGIPEAVGDTPRMAALADNNALYAQFQSGFANA